MNVLSLFDGISCGRIALERAGIKVDTYIASEINKNAIKITQHNYPDTIQIGDVTQVTEEFLNTLPPIDFLIAGSPCNDLSTWKLNIGDAKGLEGSKSKLFYHFVRILEHVKPKFILLENVVMEKQWEDIITDLLEVEPMKINSSLVCAAERERLYWTNIPSVTQPEDRGMVLADIVEPAQSVPEKYWYDLPFIYKGDDEKVQAKIDVKQGFLDRMKECYNLKGKSNTLLADGDGGNRQKKVYQDGRIRKLMPIEYERLQTLPDNYTSVVADSHRYSTIGSGWTIDVISHIFSFIK